jgi:hypothetical protein
MPRMEKSDLDELFEEMFNIKPKSKEERQKEKTEAIKSLAITNKQLFDEHIKIGFTPEQAMHIVIGINQRK